MSGGSGLCSSLGLGLYANARGKGMGQSGLSERAVGDGRGSEIGRVEEVITFRLHCEDCGGDISLNNKGDDREPDADDIAVRLESERRAAFFEEMVVAASRCQRRYPRLFTD